MTPKPQESDGFDACAIHMGTYNSGMPRTAGQDKKLRIVLIKKLVEEEIEKCKEANALNEQFLKTKNPLREIKLAKQVQELLDEIDYIDDEIKIKQKVILR